MVAGSGKLVKPCERLSPFDLFVVEMLSRADGGGKGSKGAMGGEREGIGNTPRDTPKDEPRNTSQMLLGGKLTRCCTH
jgi:hypothetical protein